MTWNSPKNACSDTYMHTHIHTYIHTQNRIHDVEFSKERLQRYVRYSKSLKPRITPEAQEKLVRYYTELRENDCTGAQRAAYRITVRQLESMVRLSEALAKVHGDLVSMYVCVCVCVVCVCV